MEDEVEKLINSGSRSDTDHWVEEGDVYSDERQKWYANDRLVAGMKAGLRWEEAAAIHQPASLPGDG